MTKIEQKLDDLMTEVRHTIGYDNANVACPSVDHTCELTRWVCLLKALELLQHDYKLAPKPEAQHYCPRCQAPLEKSP